MSLNGKIEQAFKLVLKQSDELPDELRETENFPSRIFLGADSEDQRRPCVVCHCTGGEEEDPIGSGNRFVDVSVLVKSPADPPDSTGSEEMQDRVVQHNARAAAVFGILKVDNLPDLLNETGEEIHVYDPITDESLDPDLSGRSFVDGIAFRLYCSNTIIPPY